MQRPILFLAALVLTLAAVSTTCTADAPPRSLFIKSSFLDKAVQTARSSVLSTIANFAHAGTDTSTRPLPLTFANCNVGFASMKLVMPPLQAITVQTDIVDDSKIHVTIPIFSSVINMSLSGFKVDCGPHANVAPLLVNTQGNFASSFPLSQPLRWEFSVAATKGSAAPTVTGKIVSNVAASFAAKYTTQSGFALDAYVQSFFADVTQQIQTSLQSTLSSIAAPLASTLQSSLSIVRAPCAAASNSSVASIQFVVAGPNCTLAPWSVLAPGSFLAASDVAMEMPYYDSILGQGTSSVQQCSSCCTEPCPKPLKLSPALTLSFQQCMACFLAEQSAAANVTFSN